MIIVKSAADLKKIDVNNPAHAVIRDVFAQLMDALPSYCPDTHGYLVLIEQAGAEGSLDLPELKRRLVDISWEGAWKRNGYYCAVYLTNNEFALGFVIPDADWIGGELRERLQLHADF